MAAVMRPPWGWSRLAKKSFDDFLRFQKYFRQNAGVSDSPQYASQSPVNELVARYVNYLRKDRGLAERRRTS